MSRRADQLLAGFADGDAISQEAVALRDTFRQWGWSSEIFADARHVSPTLHGQFRPLSDYRSEPDDVAIHHYSIGSPALDLFASSSAKKILIYHNITPADFFDGFDDRVAASLRAARASLPAIGARCDAVWAVSKFNAGELAALGLKNVRVFPLLFTPPQPVQVENAELVRKFARKLQTILFVGRIAPNKNIEMLIEAFYWYHKTHNPLSRLIIVGSERSCPRYFAMLRMFVGDLDVRNVGFEGFASPEGIQTYYKNADLFVTTSKHEGYCLPLIEAMHHNVPAVAPELGGIPEALNGAGVMYDGLRPAELGGLFHKILSDESLRGEVLSSQQRRLAEIRSRNLDAELAELLKGIA